MRNTKLQKLTMCALIVALSYIGFQFLRIDIPVGTERTAIHLGNAFVVIGALLQGVWGGVAGALGLTLADLTSGYVTSAPKTFILKFVMGLLASFVAKKVRASIAKKKIAAGNARAASRKDTHTAAEESASVSSSSTGAQIGDSAASIESASGDSSSAKAESASSGKGGKKLLGETRVALLSAIVALGVNVVLDPIFGYFYKAYLFGIPQDMAATLSKIGSATTLVNAVCSAIMVTVLWPVLYSALTRAGLLKK